MMTKFESWWKQYVEKCNHPCDDVEYYAAKEAWGASLLSLGNHLPDSFTIEMGAFGEAEVVTVKELVETIKQNQ